MTAPGSTDERRPSGIGATPPPRPLSTQPKRPSASQAAGTATRTLSGGMGGLPTSPDSVIRGINSAVGAFAKPLRNAAAQAGSDFAAGFSGSPRTLPAQPATAPVVAAAKPAPAAPTGGEAPAAVASLPNSPGKPTGGMMPPSKPGDPQTFTGSNGLTRQLPSYDPSGGVQSQSFGGTATPLQRTLSQPVVAPDNPTRNMGPRVQGGVIPSASGMEAGVYGGEAKRRLENDLITIGVGRPSVRRGLIEAYTQQQGAQNTAALADQNAGAAMDLQQQRGVMDANEAFAGRRLDASGLNRNSALKQQETSVQGQRVMRTLTGQDGNTNVLRNDGSLMPLTGADGQPVQERVDTGQVPPEVQYTALADQLKAITENPMLQADERQALAAPIQQQMALLANQGQHRRPKLGQFLEKARAANPGATDDELTAFYNQKYGAAR